MRYELLFIIHAVKGLLKSFRKWYVEFPLMCAGVLLLKTPSIRYLSNKTPVYKLVTITSIT